MRAARAGAPGRGLRRGAGGRRGGARRRDRRPRLQPAHRPPRPHGARRDRAARRRHAPWQLPPARCTLYDPRALRDVQRRHHACTHCPRCFRCARSQDRRGRQRARPLRRASTNHHATIEGGLLADDCGHMLSSFFAARRSKTLVAWNARTRGRRRADVAVRCGRRLHPPLPGVDRGQWRGRGIRQLLHAARSASHPRPDRRRCALRRGVPGRRPTGEVWSAQFAAAHPARTGC